MSVMMSDVALAVQDDTIPHRPPDATFDSILYADDTICASQDEESLELFLQAIEAESICYGMRLNKDKCELIQAGLGYAVGPVHFTDGTRVKVHSEVRYLGCMLNQKANQGKELNRRIQECHQILKRLDPFCLHSTCTTKFKLQVYNAIIRAKLADGMDTLHFNATDIKRLDTFQLKGLRKIRNVPTTYGQQQRGLAMTATTEHIYGLANEYITGHRYWLLNPVEGGPVFTKLSHFYDLAKKALSGQAS